VELYNVFTMINQQLFKYIKGQLQKVLTKEKIYSDLLSKGWALSDIEEGVKVAFSTTPHVRRL
jgi:hypothetical protein